MKQKIRKWISTTVAAALAMASFSCGNEFTRSASPVELLVSNTQEIFVIDLKPDAPGCDTPGGEIKVSAVLKNPGTGVDQRFNDVRLTRYRVSYVRTDGGTLVPAPFVKSHEAILTPGGADAELSDFVVFQIGALDLAPFAALNPRNGGRDPETGRIFISMDVIVEIFGETLAGANVYGRTRFPLDFCFDCGGCR